MNEAITSLIKAFKDRVANHLLGTFLFFWATCHWQFFVVLFFVSEDKIWESTHKLKNDFLNSLLFNYQDLGSWANWVLPIFLTWLFIWVLPKWPMIQAYKEECEYKAAKRRIKIASEKQLEISETELQKQKEKKFDSIIETMKKEVAVKVQDPTFGWEEEYGVFKKTSFFKNFSLVVESVYSRNGNVTVYEYSDEVFAIPENLLAYCHTSGLVNLQKGIITLTEKGKYFVKRFTADEKI
jgi:hypothetical protein